jgi:hypothetical protein
MKFKSADLVKPAPDSWLNSHNDYYKFSTDDCAYPCSWIQGRICKVVAVDRTCIRIWIPHLQTYAWFSEYDFVFANAK